MSPTSSANSDSKTAGTSWIRRMARTINTRRTSFGASPDGVKDFLAREEKILEEYESSPEAVKGEGRAAQNLDSRMPPSANPLNTLHSHSTGPFINRTS